MSDRGYYSSAPSASEHARRDFGHGCVAVLVLMLTVGLAVWVFQLELWPFGG